jgi:hypothetical protein
MNKPEKLNLKEWAAEDRPREKMKQKGAKALTNAELLAILIHTGNTEDSVVALTQKVMASCRNSLAQLGRLSVEELCSFKGIGEAKAITILAACELGRRRKEEEPVKELSDIKMCPDDERIVKTMTREYMENLGTDKLLDNEYLDASDDTSWLDDPDLFGNDISIIIADNPEADFVEDDFVDGSFEQWLAENGDENIIY